MKSIIYKLILPVIIIFLPQHAKSQTIDIGTYNSNFEYIKDNPITSSYTSLYHKFTITVPMKIEVSFCGSNGLSGYCSSDISGFSLSFAADMCSSDRIISKENVPAGTYTISYTNYSSSGNIKFRISGIGGVQPGDTFDSPINIGTFNKNFTYSDARNTEYYKNSFEGKPTNDIFYKIVLTAPTDIKIKYSGEVIKAFYSILSSSGTLLSSQMISGGIYYSLENMQPGTYYIVAEGYKLNGSITTIVEGVSKINGNTFSYPIEAGVFENNFVYTDTKNSTDYTDNFKGMPTKDIFYRFSINKPMDLNISHCGSALSDTYLHLLSSSGDIIAFNDNYTGTGQCSNTNHANLRLQKLAAGTYYIVSEGKTTDGSITTKIEGISSPSYANTVIPVSKNSNYIATITPLDATKQAGLNNGEIKVDNNARTNISIEYYDGLGRPIQTVQRGLTPSGKDLVSIQEYDNFGRKSNTWLPGTSSANGAYNDSETIKNATVSLNGSDARPYTANIYEQASTGRLLDNYGPGIDWYNNGRSVNSSYKINVTNSTGCDPKLVCALYQVVETVNLKKEKDYEGGTLYVTQLTDENGNLTYEFKNKQEQLILTRQIENNIRYDTYYVYDDYGNLCFVLPPLAADALTAVNTTWNEETAAIKDYAYVYRYDYKDRCILKKLPGCEPIYYVYDKADQLIFTQDGELRKKEEWAFTIPDALGRTVLTQLGNHVDTIIF